MSRRPLVFSEVNINSFHSRYIPEPNSGCWLWEGATDTKGYGQIRTKERLWQAHRFSYFLKYPTDDTSLCVLHRCDTPCCVNPNHLFLGTQQENMKDMHNKGRNRVPKPSLQGEKHHSVILQETQVLEIISKYQPRKYTIDMLSSEYGVSSSTISKIVQRKLWKHIKSVPI